VPEPGTGLPVGLGLVALDARRPARSRRHFIETSLRNAHVVSRLSKEGLVPQYIYEMHSQNVKLLFENPKFRE
jgi:hypothetical protein